MSQHPLLLLSVDALLDLIQHLHFYLRRDFLAFRAFDVSDTVSASLLL